MMAHFGLISHLGRAPFWEESDYSDFLKVNLMRVINLKVIIKYYHLMLVFLNDNRCGGTGEAGGGICVSFEGLGFRV